MCWTLAAIVLLGAADPKLRRVPEDYPTIQAALDAAEAGDVVRVARGVYEGPFRLAKALSLEGAEGAVLRGGGPILTVTASGAVLRGLTFERGGKALVIDRARGVDVLDCRFLDNGGDQLSFEHAGGAVRGCLFRNAGDDNIDIDGASDPVIEDNVLEGAADDNIEMRFQRYDKPELLRTVIRRNSLSGAKAGDGIQLIDYPGATARVVRIERNTIRGAAWAGIGSMENGRTKQGDFPDAPRGSPQVEKIYVLHNTLAGNRYGVSGGHAMLLLNNIITDCRGSALRRVKGRSAVVRTCLWNNALDYDETPAGRDDLKAPPKLDAALRLQHGSPCAGAGAASVVWDGESVEGGPDLGAYEAAGPPSVSVRASGSAFTLTRSGPRAAPLKVAFRLGGHDGELTIPAGEAEATLPVRRDAELRLLPGAGYALGRPASAVVTIDGDDGARPSVTVEATVSTASERGAVPAVFTFTRSGARSSPLVVRFALSGEALNGVDYERRASALTIPAGAASATLTIVPLDDAVADEEEVTLTLTADPAYRIGAPAGATVTIDDDD